MSRLCFTTLGFNVFVEAVYFLDFCVMFRTLFLGVNTLYICKCVFCIMMWGEKKERIYTHTHTTATKKKPQTGNKTDREQ